MQRHMTRVEKLLLCAMIAMGLAQAARSAPPVAATVTHALP